jgi:Tyrosine phosphatase family
MFTRHRVWFWCLIGTLLVGGSVLTYRHHKRYKHLAVHDAHMVYRSAWLDSDVFRELIEEYQIRTVLNLCEPDELGNDLCVGQRQAVRGSGAKLIEMPMPASTLDPANPEIAKFIPILSNPENYPMLVHCQHGVTRTAKVLVMYDILYRGMTAEQSIAAMPLFGHDDYPVSVRAFARNFEEQYRNLYPQAQGKLDILRR